MPKKQNLNQETATKKIAKEILHEQSSLTQMPIPRGNQSEYSPFDIQNE